MAKPRVRLERLRFEQRTKTGKIEHAAEDADEGEIRSKKQTSSGTAGVMYGPNRNETHPPDGNAKRGPPGIGPLAVRHGNRDPKTGDSRPPGREAGRVARRLPCRPSRCSSSQQRLPERGRPQPAPTSRTGIGWPRERSRWPDMRWRGRESRHASDKNWVGLSELSVLYIRLSSPVVQKKRGPVWNRPAASPHTRGLPGYVEAHRGANAWNPQSSRWPPIRRTRG